MNYTFNGPNKIITPSDAPTGGAISIDVQELYSRWVDWFLTSDNSKYLMAMRVVGGDSLPGSMQLGITYFMLNGWKVRPYEATHVFTLNGNLYCEDGSSPYVPTVGAYNVTIINSVSNLVDSSVQQLPEIEHASFNGGVTVNVLDGVSGTAYPTGTEKQPVDNFIDALLIAQERGFSRLYLLGVVTLDSGLDFSNMIIEGDGPMTTVITVSAAANVSGCQFRNASVDGTLDQNAWLEECDIGNLSYMEGRLVRCALEGVLTIGGDGALLIDCYSTRLDPSEVGVIDVNGVHNVAVHNFSGHLKIRNMTGGYAGLSFGGAGRLTIESTCTGGMIHVMGNVKVTDSSAGATVLTNYVTSPSAVSGAVLSAIAEDDKTFADLLRGMAAVLFGKMIRAPVTGLPATVTVRDVGDTKDRSVVTIDVNGIRTLVSLDLS